MSYSRVIFQSLLQSSRRPSLRFAASSFSASRLSHLPLPTPLNLPSELKPISSFTPSFTHRLLHSTSFAHSKYDHQQGKEEDPVFYETAENGETTDGREEGDDEVQPKTVVKLMESLAESCNVKMLEDVSYVSPPPGSLPATSLPLTFFDRFYLFSLPDNWMRRLFFYEFKHPTLYFMQTVLPELKTSLSATLQHFFPFAGNLIIPSPPRMPYFLYKEGDSVSFIVNVSTADFNHLVGDHARDYREFKALLPNRPPAIVHMSSHDCKQEAVLAIQVTVFPDVGFSIGVGYSHVVTDGRTIAHFMKSWASIHRCRGDFTCLDHNYLPCFDRKHYLINDAVQLAPLNTKEVKRTSSEGWIPPNVSLNNFQVTYRIKRSEVELLKDWVKRKSMEVKGSEAIGISTFAVTCAYLWVCLIKLQQTGTHDDQHLDSDELCYFRFAADCRDHLKLPETYFGNCIITRLAEAKKSELLGQNGVVVAASAIGRETTEFKKQTFEAALEASLEKIEKSKMGKDVIWAASSPKYQVYKTDFGWGRARKIEVGMLESFGSRYMFCIAESREEEGGIEFDLAFDLQELDKFNVVFQEGLLKLKWTSK